jgi:PAS domain S-box-containing protein
MNDLERERDFYRQQCNELGRHLLRLQEEQTRARRDARRNRTTASLIREIYRNAGSNISVNEINLCFLQIVLDTLSVDRAALLEYIPEQKQFVIQNALGFSQSPQSSVLPPELPAEYYFVNSKNRPNPMIEWLCYLADGPFLLWAFDPGARLALLVSNDIEDQHLHRPFEANDREIIEGALNVLIEITERKRAEEALQESEKKYRLLAENVSDNIWTTDLNFRFTYVSPSVVALNGYTADEAIELSMGEVLTPNSIEIATQALYEELEREGKYDVVDQEISRTLELEEVCKDGSIIPVEVKVSFLRDAAGQPSGLLGITRDITERKEAEALIKTSLQEKEILLKEIHHRVKNNLQVISSLLDLQANCVENKQVVAAFRDSQARLRTMALIHEKLYQSANLAEINLADYARDLVTYLLRSQDAAKRGISLNIQTDDVLLDIDKAIPCGLILNELVSNSLKHAFPQGQTGKICVELHVNDANRSTMMIGDNGIGFPEELNFRHPTSLGLQLVNTLVNQLNGVIELDCSQGTTFKIIFSAN